MPILTHVTGESQYHNERKEEAAIPLSAKPDSLLVA
jgi:hypothetical protein